MLAYIPYRKNRLLWHTLTFILWVEEGTMTVEAVDLSRRERLSDDMELMLAASCLSLPEAVIGLVAARQARERGEAADWSALDSLAVVAVAVLGGAVVFAALVSAFVP